MCLGNTQTGQQIQNVTMPSWLTGQAQQNLATANDLNGQPYVGQQVAPFSQDQQASFGNIESIAGAPNANNPYLGQIQQNYRAYGSAPAQNVNLPSVLGGGVDPATASLNQYIDPNLQTELNPTLANIEHERQIAVSGAGGVGSQATTQGGTDAFGDARAGVAEAQTNAAALRAGATATGQAYQNAFTNAMSLRGMDLSNSLNAQTTNAGLNEQALARVLGGGNALQGLATSQTGQGLTLAQALNSAGQQEQQQAQAQMNLPWLNNMGSLQFELSQLGGLNQALAAATPAAGKTTDTTTFGPNNALLALAGAVTGGIFGNGGGGANMGNAMLATGGGGGTAAAGGAAGGAAALTPEMLAMV